MNKRIEMTLAKWYAIPDNPRQRDTEKHAQVARKFHLRQASPTHQFVSAASIDGEIVCKLDGHTRAYLWESGELSPPKSGKVIVEVYQVKSLQEAAYLYTHFDNAKAAETSTDRVSGALRECGVVLTSGWLRGGRFITVLKILANDGTFPGVSWHATTEYELVRKFAVELATVDSWQLPGSLPTAMLLLALALIKNGEQESLACEFYKRTIEGDTTKTEHGWDGPGAIAEHIKIRRAEKRMNGWENIVDIAERGLTAFAAFKEGRRIKAGLRTSSLAVYLGQSRA